MIQAQIIADSLSPQGDRLITYKCTFPRYILAEVNTHRAFSRNSASSRAIPFSKMIKMVQENPFIPMAWQKDHKGMQGTEYLLNEDKIDYAIRNWLLARDQAILQAKVLNHSETLGVTKQLCNRLLEPFMWHTAIITSSEEGLENFFNLRCPQYEGPLDDDFYKSWKDLQEEVKITTGEYIKNCSILNKLRLNKGQADIHIMALAEAMWDARNESTPKQLEAGEWHIPFGDNMDETELSEAVSNTIPFSEAEEADSRYDVIMDEARCKIAVARCARLSYQTLGENPKIDYEADLKLYARLAESGHWSPFEHVARAMSNDEYDNWIRGEGYEDFGGVFSSNQVFDEPDKGWCRNFRGFIQMRQLID